MRQHPNNGGQDISPVDLNGMLACQIEPTNLGINPRRAIEQIVEYKNDPGNGYTRTLLCFVQLFIVSNRDSTYYFANNNARHFSFNADERFLPIYQNADPGITKGAADDVLRLQSSGKGNRLCSTPQT